MIKGCASRAVNLVRRVFEANRASGWSGCSRLPGVWVFLVLSWGILDGREGAAQNRPAGLSGSGATITRYYPAPNFKQMDLKIVGEELVPEADNSKRIRAVKPAFSAYQTTGIPILTLQTPECVWDETDPQARNLNSAEALAMTTGDGRFHIEGRGFLWAHNERVLTISNDVRAVVYWTNNAPPLVVTSRWFRFEADLRRGVFHDDVRGEDPNQTFTCQQLALRATTNNIANGLPGRAATNRVTFDLVEADGGFEVIGKQPGQFGRAQRGVYHHADQRLELEGAAVVDFSPYAGRADRMTVWLNSTNIDAVGNVKLSLPRGALGAAGSLLSATNQASRAVGTNLVTLTTDHFTRRDERLLAEGRVRVNDGTNVLTCERLEGRQATPRALDEYAIATGNVFVGRQGGGIYSDRADYSKANNQVAFTGQPRFVQGEVSGTAGRVIVRTLTSEVLAEDDVAVTFPLAARRGSFMNFLPVEGTNRVAAGKTDEKAAIKAQSFRLQERRGIFSGGVEVHQLPADGGESRLRCGELEVWLAPDKKHAQSLLARNQVVCERGTIGVTNGPAEYTRLDCATLRAQANPATGELVQLLADGGVDLRQTASRAQGAQAVYTHADQVLRLRGSPRIERPEGVYRSEKELIWDNAHQVVRGADFKISTDPALLKGVEDLDKLR